MKIQDEFKESIKKAGFELSEIKDLFIIEQIQPFLTDETLTESLRVRLMDINDYKKRVSDAVERLKMHLTNPELCRTTEAVIGEFERELEL